MGPMACVVTWRAVTLFGLVFPGPGVIEAGARVAAVLSHQSRMIELDARVNIGRHDSGAGGSGPDLVGSVLGNIPFDALCRSAPGLLQFRAAVKLLGYYRH